MESDAESTCDQRVRARGQICSVDACTKGVGPPAWAVAAAVGVIPTGLAATAWRRRSVCSCHANVLVRPERTVLAASRWRCHVSPSSRRNVSHRTSKATVPTPTEQADGPRRTVIPRVRGGSEAQMMTVRQESVARELHDGGGVPRKSRGCSVSRRCTQHWNRQWKPILVEFPLLSSFRRIRTGCKGRAPSNDPPKHMWLLLEQADPELHVSDAPVVEADDNCSAAADLEGAVHAQIELSVLS